MSQQVTTNFRLDQEELHAFRMIATSMGVSFNSFALQALRAEATRRLSAYTQSEQKQTPALTLRDLSNLPYLAKSKGAKLTKLDEELYDI